MIRKILTLVKEWADDMHGVAGNAECKKALRNLIDAIEQVEAWY
jgi:hypothetical protein